MKRSCNIYTRNMKHFVADQFLEDLDYQLSEFDSAVMSESNPNPICDRFFNVFNDTLNKHAPFREVTRLEQKLRKKTWITKGILVSIKTKNQLYRRTLKDKSQSAIRHFKSYRNTLTHVKELAKKQYFNNQVQNARHNSKLVWKTINDLVRYKKIRSQDITGLEFENDKIIENDSEISKAFNDYFATIGSNLANKIPEPSTNSCGKPCSVTP